MRATLLTTIALAWVTVGLADTVDLSSGNSIGCTILQTSPANVTVMYRSGVIRIPRSSIVSVNPAAAGSASGATVNQRAERLPDEMTVAVTVAAQPWASDFHQIPATVIDKGVMRYVPYKSHRAGRDYEINVYGDPYAPAGFEVGVRYDLLKDDVARKNCIEVACKLLGEAADRALLRNLSLEKDRKVQNGVTFEITPPTDPDAYGGWWVSVYNEIALDSSRASEEELKSITVAKSAVKANQGGRAISTEGLDDWSTEDLTYAREPTSSPRKRVSSKMPAPLNYARQSTPSPIARATGGEVYVRGYTRKDGTYVSPHTRSAPHR